jgi:hypothetical protein
MRLDITMKYLQRTGSGIRYRRELPSDLQRPLGKKWFTHPLGESHRDAAKNCRDDQDHRQYRQEHSAGGTKPS